MMQLFTKAVDGIFPKYVPGTSLINILSRPDIKLMFK